MSLHSFEAEKILLNSTDKMRRLSFASNNRYLFSLLLSSQHIYFTCSM